MPEHSKLISSWFCLMPSARRWRRYRASGWRRKALAEQAGRAGLARTRAQGGAADPRRLPRPTYVAGSPCASGEVNSWATDCGGLGDAAGPRTARKITDEQVEVLVTRTLSERGPGQDSHWSTRSMAAETGLSQSSVSRIWRAFGLDLRRQRPAELSTDPGVHRGKIRAYRRPLHEPAGGTPWSVKLVDEVADRGPGPDRAVPAGAPDDPARMARRLPLRHRNLFAALDLASGSVIAKPTGGTAAEFCGSWKYSRHGGAEGLDLHLVLDNYTRDPQDARDPPVAADTTVTCLHPDQLELDEPGPRWVRQAHQPQALQLSAHPASWKLRDRHPQVDARVEQNPAIRPGPDRRRRILDLAACCNRIIDSGHWCRVIVDA